VSPGSFGIEKAETFATPMPANPVTVTFLRWVDTEVIEVTTPVKEPGLRIQSCHSCVL
jgi:hypothetical protein